MIFKSSCDQLTLLVWADYPLPATIKPAYIPMIPAQDALYLKDQPSWMEIF